MQRPDREIIQRALKGGRNVLGDTTNLGEILKLALDKPLVSMTDTYFDQTPVGQFEQKLRDNDSALLPEPVFDEWVLQTREQGALVNSPIDDELEYYSATVWACFLDFECPQLMALKHYPDHAFEGKQREAMSVFGGKYCVVLIQYDDQPSVYVWQGWTHLKPKNADSPRDSLLCNAISSPSSKDYWGERITGLVTRAKWAFHNSLLTWMYAKYGDKHIVEVVPTKAKAQKKSSLHKNRPWTTASGPHILFLDRMPTTQKEGTGTHASPKPHRRRGHWKTLNHPRFRHHPQYQQKIYVKPSFVGPRQTTYEGNIYRLVQPLEERLS